MSPSMPWRCRRFILPLATCAGALALTACGGGGGGGVNSTPPAPVTPTPTPTPSPSPTGASIVTGATSSQQFAVLGASYATPSASYAPIVVSVPSLGAGAQLQVRYDATAQRYEVLLPGNAAWSPLHTTATHGEPGNQIVLYRADSPLDFGMWDHRRTPTLQYSALLEWWTDSSSGFSAIGVATLPGAMPTSGNASYTGSLLGSSSETVLDPWEALWYPISVGGSISLAFNFGTGSFSGSISPMVMGSTLPSLNFTNTVYSSGSTTFSGTFGTSLSGVNSFSGRFTGPAAQEVIGNFAFPYQSLQDGSNQQAAGVFAGKKQ